MCPVRAVTLEDLDDLAFGAALFGTGGGGSVDGQLLSAKAALAELGPVPLVDIDDLPPDSLVMPLSGIGAPVVSHEVLRNGHEAALIRAAVERELGRPVAAVMSSELGGGNGVEPVMWAARLGLPIVDGDGMGRAFPEVQMVTYYVCDMPVTPVFLSDVQGNVTVVHPVSGEWSEPIARSVTVAMGSSALMADYVLPAGVVKDAIVRSSMSRAIRVGRAVRTSTSPLAAIEAELNATRLITGKIREIERRTGGGFVRGSVIVEGSGADRDRLLRIEIQNENLIALEDGQPLAVVPDLISVVDSTTGRAIATEELKYGLRVAVMAWPCDPIWRTPKGLRTAGPEAFGYDVTYVPIEEVRRGRAS